MTKQSSILVLVCCLLGAAESAFVAGGSDKRPLPEGFVLKGVDGRLHAADANDRYFFEFTSDVNDAKVQIGAGTALELLPCLTLEMLAADANNRSSPQFRLWARVTQYKGENYLFAVFYLPLSKVEGDRAATAKARKQKSGQEPATGISDSNDELGIPREILAQLEQDRLVRAPRPEKPRPESPEKKTAARNRVMVDVLGFIRQEERRAVFVPDALGRNTAKSPFELLPCRALELAQRVQSAEPDPVRFAIAGLVTEYKGTKYLLLQRAIRVYSHGNFGR